MRRPRVSRQISVPGGRGPQNRRPQDSLCSSGSSPPTPGSLNTPRAVFLRTGAITIPLTLSRLKLTNAWVFLAPTRLVPAPFNSHPLPCSGPRGRLGQQMNYKGNPGKQCPRAKGDPTGARGRRVFGVRDRAEAQAAPGSLWWNGSQCHGLTLAWCRGGTPPGSSRTQAPGPASSIPVFPPSPRVLGFHCFGVLQGPLAQKL